MTMFDGSEETIYNVTYPLYATYMKLFGSLLIAILVVMSSSFVIYVILKKKNKELRNANNALIINLLITDIICTVTLCSFLVPVIISYLAEFDLYYNCDTIMPFMGWLTMSSRMMILPPAVHRFICVARPFTHHIILTKRRIILMIVALWAIPTIPFVVLGSSIRTAQIPSLGSYVVIHSDLQFGVFLALTGYVLSFLLTIISAVYLRHKIIHIKAYIRDLQQSDSNRRKLNRSQRLKELLSEQVKPTIGVFVVGGMDGVCNLLIGTILVFFRVFSTPIVQFQIYQTVVVPLFYLQTLSHSLSYGFYNKEIRDEMFPWYPKQSRVIVLNRQ